jgi:hypothetical protein
VTKRPKNYPTVVYLPPQIKDVKSKDTEYREYAVTKVLREKQKARA